MQMKLHVKKPMNHKLLESHLKAFPRLLLEESKSLKTRKVILSKEVKKKREYVYNSINTFTVFHTWNFISQFPVPQELFFH